jgi:quercetin dioxygenase-like cupin family protein
MATNEPTAQGPPGEVANVRALVRYQEGAVVSRTVVKRPSGSVTVFAFDAAQTISEHTVPYDAVVHVLEGEAEVTVGGRAHRVAEGEMLLMPAGQPHALRALSAFKMMLAMLRV